MFSSFSVCFACKIIGFFQHSGIKQSSDNFCFVQICFCINKYFSAFCKRLIISVLNIYCPIVAGCTVSY